MARPFPGRILTGTSAPLSSNLDDEQAAPSFLWDDPMTLAERRERLRTASEPERYHFAPHLGRRRAFWEYTLRMWREPVLLEQALRSALDKDGGVTPAQPGWVLSGWATGDDARIPGGQTPAALRSDLGQLRERLSRMSWPGSPR